MASANEQLDDPVCRFCFGTEEEGDLVAPCCCAGGQKWVHRLCLRRWQREVLAASRPRPEVANAETRHRVCSICNAVFTIQPPSHLELLVSYTGQQLAGLVAERSLIVANHNFSAALQRQAAASPFGMQGIGAGGGGAHQHWIRGVFLIVGIASSNTQRLSLTIETLQQLENFAADLQDGWHMSMDDHPMRIVMEGSLEGCQVASNAAASTVQQAVRELSLPVSLSLEEVYPPDESEDGIFAVNLTRCFDLVQTDNLYQIASYRGTECAILAKEGDVKMLAEVRHLIGGPCDEDEVSCCIIGGGGRPYVVRLNLTDAIQEAHQLAKSGHPQEVKLLVFWGSAGWSRVQLISEVAQGSWGLCKSIEEDIAGEPASLWETVHQRVSFAPSSDITIDYRPMFQDGGETASSAHGLADTTTGVLQHPPAQLDEGALHEDEESRVCSSTPSEVDATSRPGCRHASRGQHTSGSSANTEQNP